MKRFLFLFALLSTLIIFAADPVKPPLVKALADGYKKFEITPFNGDFKSASGTVDTPSGRIFVIWSKAADGLELTVRHPDDLELVDTLSGKNPAAALKIQPYKAIKKPQNVRWISHRGESYCVRCSCAIPYQAFPTLLPIPI